MDAEGSFLNKLFQANLSLTALIRGTRNNFLILSFAKFCSVCHKPRPQTLFNDSSNNEILIINLGTVRAERNTIFPHAQNRKTFVSGNTI